MSGTDDGNVRIDPNPSHEQPTVVPGAFASSERPVEINIGQFSDEAARPVLTQAPVKVLPGTGRTVQIFFFRHAESCANMLKKLGRPAEQSRYLDPDLTRRGETLAEAAAENAAVHINAYEPQNAPVRIGASILLRAQQTARKFANRILGVEEGEKFVLVLPYISEVQKTGAALIGLGKDNQAMKRDQKLELREKTPGRLDYRPYDDEAVLKRRDISNEISVGKFFEWLGRSLPHIFGNEYNTSQILRLIIITHAGWLENLTSELGSKKHYDNLNGVGVHALFDSAGKLIEKKWLDPSDPQHQITLVTPAMVSAISSPCPDKCRSGTLCSSRITSYHERIKGMIVDVYKMNSTAGITPDFLASIRDLERDLRIDELYKTAPNRDILKILDRMKGYGSDVSRILIDLFQLIDKLGLPKYKLRPCESWNAFRRELYEKKCDLTKIPEELIRLHAMKTFNEADKKTMDSYISLGIFGKKSRKTLPDDVDDIRGNMYCNVVDDPTPGKQCSSVTDTQQRKPFISWWTTRGGARRTRRRYQKRRARCHTRGRRRDRRHTSRR